MKLFYFTPRRLCTACLVHLTIEQVLIAVGGVPSKSKEGVLAKSKTGVKEVLW